MFPIIKFDQENKNIFFLAFLSLLGCLQLLVIAVLIIHPMPIKSTAFVTTLFKYHLQEVRPEREMLYYRIFVVALIVCQTLMVLALRRRLKDPTFTDALKSFVRVEAVWVSLQAFFIFKIIVDPNLVWAKPALYVLLAASVISKVFWPEFQRVLTGLKGCLQDSVTMRFIPHVFSLLMVAFIAVFLYMPDVQKTLALVFRGDRFYHIDSFFMAPTWAVLKGNTLNIDTTSEYSVFVPQLLSRWAKVVDHFSYTDVIYVMMFFAIIYVVLFYFFLRRWTGSVLIAGFGILLVLKLHFFHLGVFPIIWRFPSATPMRFWFDIVAFFLLYRYLETANRKWLAAAAIICGVALSYLIDTGLYLTASFYGFVVLTFLWPHYRKIFWKERGSAQKWLPALFILPPATAFLISWALQGPTIFTKIFWTNTFEFLNLFVQGWGALPMYAGLRDRNFFAFIMGFSIPIVYVATLVFVGALCYLNKIHRRNLFVLFISAYGLCLYHYFIHRSAVTSFYVVCFPLVFLICFWFQKIIAFFKPMMRHVVLCLAIVITFLGLMTNRLIALYPNLLNTSGYDWDKDIERYKDGFDLSDDARLISSLTNVNERVALISSFEVKILMQADRAPFFYYFPLMESGLMNKPVIYSTYIHTYPRMRTILTQLELSPPRYIFVEKKIYSGKISDYFMVIHESLRDLMGYVRARYDVYEEGKYLVVLKRKN